MKVKFSKKSFLFIAIALLGIALVYFFLSNKSIFEGLAASPTTTKPPTTKPTTKQPITAVPSVIPMNVRGEILDTVGNFNGKKISNCYELGKDDKYGLPAFATYYLSEYGGDFRYIQPNERCPYINGKEYGCDFKLRTGNHNNPNQPYEQLCMYLDPNSTYFSNPSLKR